MICLNCVSHSRLKQFIIDSGVKDSCSYCKELNVCVEDNALFDLIMSITDNILVPTEHLSFYEQATIFECGSDTPAVFERWEFLHGLAQFACDDFIEKLMDWLPDEEDENGFPVLYALNDGRLDELNEFEGRWKEFVDSISCGYRFFNETIKIFLDELFQVILSGDSLDGSLVVTLNNDTPIYRARVAENNSILKEIQACPASQLGPTPAHLSSNQRMSPDGVSVFYGAFDRATCVSEIRPLVGDVVISGEFRVLSELRVLDLNKLALFNTAVDEFHECYLQHSHALSFFNELVFKMSRPAKRGDRSTYLATQVFFEYLRFKFCHQIDGLMYCSVQQDQKGLCVALFPECSHVSSEAKCQLEEPDNPFFVADKSKLYYVPDSLRFHRVRGVSYEQEEHEDDYLFVTNDSLLRKFGDRF